MFSGARQLTFIIRPRIGSDENIVHSGFVRTKGFFFFGSVHFIWQVRLQNVDVMDRLCGTQPHNQPFSGIIKIETLQACRFCGLLVPQSKTLLSQPMRMINYKQLSLPMSPSTVCERSIWSPSALISDACVHITISLTTSTLLARTLLVHSKHVTHTYSNCLNVHLQ